MNITKPLFTVLTVAMSLGAVAPAMASSFSTCKFIEGTSSSGSLAKHCHRYIVGEGQISIGKHRGEYWKDVFPNYKFRSYDDPRVSVKIGNDAFGEFNDAYNDKVTWKVDGKDSIKTIQFSLEDGWADFGHQRLKWNSDGSVYRR